MMAKAKLDHDKPTMESESTSFMLFHESVPKLINPSPEPLDEGRTTNIIKISMGL
jgi:hypothetical protein